MVTHKAWFVDMFHYTGKGNKIFPNEKYIGDALLQKTVTYDLLEKKRKKNVNDAPQYYVSEAHEAIIPKEVYYRVQEEMARRSNLLGEAFAEWTVSLNTTTVW